MLPPRFIWFAWCCLLLAGWVVVYFLTAPANRRVMLWSSAITLPFALTQPLFLLFYWNPPSLWNLSQRIHIDIESFLFCFAIGGVGGIAFNTVTGRRVVIPRKCNVSTIRQQANNGAIALPLAVFMIALFALSRPMIAGLLALAAGALARFLLHPNLLRKSFGGGVFFALYYTSALFVLQSISPSYIRAFWRPQAFELGQFAGLPVVEILFGFFFGTFWSGLYEQVLWTIATPRSVIRTEMDLG